MVGLTVTVPVGAWERYRIDVDAQARIHSMAERALVRAGGDGGQVSIVTVPAPRPGVAVELTFTAPHYVGAC